jgi:hypothetical protein
MLAIFYEILTGRAPDMLRAYVLIVLIQMVALNALIELGYLKITIPPFFGMATALSGFVFGLGMVLAVGCAGAIFYRAGEAKLDSIFAMIAYAVSAWASHNWLVEPIRGTLHGKGMQTTLHHAVGMNRWIIIAIVAMGVIFWLIRARRVPYHGGWNWARTGLFLGLTGIITWTVSAMMGEPGGLGTVHGMDRLGAVILKRDLSALDWTVFMVVGIPFGSFISSWVNGKSPGKPFRLERVLHSLIGGLLMGLGAGIANGDNITHGLSGVPLLAMSGLTFMFCIFIGVWVGVRLGWLK